jgi:glycosyltransferase involved in cell wall biosynthesis
MKKKKLISIIITNYNKEKFIKKCLLSSLNQNYKNFEIILFDDRSTDNSLEIIKKFKKIRLIKNRFKNKNYSSPQNQIHGIMKSFQLSKGEIICLLDADDIFDKKKLSKVHDFFNTNKEKKFLVNYPHIKNKNFIVKNLHLKQSKWPTVFPTSCISFRRVFFKKFLQNIKKNDYSNLEIDARLAIYSNSFLNDFNIIKNKLTNYTIDSTGISSKYPKFSINWWTKRYEAFQYLRFILKKRKLLFKPSFDFYLTRLLFFLKSTILR